MKRSVAVVGARGFFGSALCASRVLNEHFEVVAVTRENFEQAATRRFDVLVNCAMPAARFRAKNDPAWDFRATVELTARLFEEWHHERFVQVSSLSARTQLHTVYGRHKAAAEQLCDPARSWVVRFGALYGSALSKGVLVDLVAGRTVYVDGASRYCFAPVDFLANWVASNLDRTGLTEAGGRNAVSLRDIAVHLRSPSRFEGELDHQELAVPDPAFPEARDVLAFLDTWRGPRDASA